MDLEGKLVKLATLEAAFDHFTNKHWIPLQAIILSLHDSLCWTCKGNGEPIPDRARSASAPPSLSIAIPIPLPCSGQRPPTPGPPPLSPVTDNNSSAIPNSSTNSSPDPFRVERRTFQVAQGLDGLIWTKEERAALQAFLSHYTSEEGVDVTILEAGVGDRSPGGSGMLSESFGLGEGVSGPLYPKLSTSFEGIQLTQLVQLVTAGRLFLGHKGQVNPYMDECLYHYVCFGHEGFLLQVSLQVTAMA